MKPSSMRVRWYNRAMVGLYLLGALVLVGRWINEMEIKLRHQTQTLKQLDRLLRLLTQLSL